ncbi:hypothetical protein [Streptomyces sp. enrichment culture]|uniref:hypothetical protein n=1 Tax=Streptomyces sp. enrichment culture TaxID=1795815 RepID=UPI003F567DFC
MKSSVTGVVDIAYSHFYLAEDGSEEALPDFRTDEPVIATPGRLTIISRLQSHTAPVTLALAREPAARGDWQLVGTAPYRPVATGRIAAYSLEAGAATDWLTLDTGTLYTAHVYAQGRRDSRERHDAAVSRGEYGRREGYESYLTLFVPCGTQPQPATSPARRSVVDNIGRRPANWQ